MRLGFAITTPELAEKITQQLGPWNISGPAQYVGQKALSDTTWVDETRNGLASMAVQLSDVLKQNGLNVIGGTDLFQLAETASANALHTHLCHNHILTRIFPYSEKWVRLGFPASTTDLSRLNEVLGRF